MNNVPFTLEKVTINPIGDEKNTLRSFMAFNITSYKSVFRVVIGSQIVVIQQIFMMSIYCHLQVTTYTSIMLEYLTKMGQIILFSENAKCY